MIRPRSILTVLLILSGSVRAVNAFSTRPHVRPIAAKPPSSESRLGVSTTPPSSSATTAGLPNGSLKRIPINESYKGLKLIHSNPDIFTISNFLDDASCQDLIRRAQANSMDQSPVAYAGWTTDVRDLLELSAKGPVAWIALISAWVQLHDGESVTQLGLAMRVLENYAAAFVVAAAAIVAFTKFRTDGLQALRTSTSTTLDDLSSSSGTGTGTEENGSKVFVANAARLFDGNTPLAKEARLFEAPTVIRYEKDQVLAPHFDANRSADTEDANRGGQTLATLLVYLNDVEEGGLTRFGRLNGTTKDGDSGSNNGAGQEGFLTVKPKRGDALLFFPADRNGVFDERVEHEGCPAVDEKWIARIWRHIDRVPPPYGLSNDAIGKL